MTAKKKCEFQRGEIVSLYIYQSQLFWSLVSPISIIEIASLAGWFVAQSQGFTFAGNLSLAGGILFLIFQALLLNRSGQYLGHYGAMLEALCDEKPPSPWLALNGRRLAIGLCLTLILAHTVLLFLPVHKDAPGPDKPVAEAAASGPAGGEQTGTLPSTANPAGGA